MTWPQYLRRECTVQGFNVRLSRLQAEILLILMLRFPGPVKTSEFVEAIWHEAMWANIDAEPSTAPDVVIQTIQHLKKNIGGFHIVGRRSYGYTLVQEPPPKRGRKRGQRGPIPPHQRLPR
jgi:DNA-binding response OmpR family regulator